MSDPPLLSQDEFFRYLDLQSVLASQSGGKAFYRQALKERLRATSKANYYNNHKKTDKKQSPQVSPCKWLSDSDRKRMFGRPRVRVELNRASQLELSNKEGNSSGENSEKQPLIRPLIDNCHVLRHPGIKTELEARARNPAGKQDKAKTDVVARVAYLKRRHCRNGIHHHPTAASLTSLPTESVQVKAVHDSPHLPLHCICSRPQPGRAARDEHASRESVRKAATRALFGHGDSDVKLTALGPSSVTKVKPLDRTASPVPPPSPLLAKSASPKQAAITKAESQVKKSPKKFPRICLTGNAQKLLTSSLLHSPSSNQSKGRNNNYEAKEKKLLKETHLYNVDVVKQPQCKECGRKYKVSTSSPLKSWKEAVQSSSLCEKCRALAHLKKHVASRRTSVDLISLPLNSNRSHMCDICYKSFGKRSHMIRHVTNVHPLNIHKVDLAKFATFKTPRPGNVHLVRRTAPPPPSPWLEPSPTKQPHLKQFITT